MSGSIQGVRNSGKAEYADIDGNDDNGVDKGAKRARQQGSSMKNNVGSNSSSSNSYNNVSNNSPNSNNVFREGKNTVSVGNGTETWGGSRAGAGRKPNVSANMHLGGSFNDNNGNSSADVSSVTKSAVAKKREASKREMSRLLEIEKETCRTRGSGLTVETCLIVISLFTQRIREAISMGF